MLVSQGDRRVVVVYFVYNYFQFSSDSVLPVRPALICLTVHENGGSLLETQLVVKPYEVEVAHNKLIAPASTFIKGQRVSFIN